MLLFLHVYSVGLYRGKWENQESEDLKESLVSRFLCTSDFVDIFVDKNDNTENNNY